MIGIETIPILSLIAAFWIIGVDRFTSEGWPGHFVRVFLEKYEESKLGFLLKPVLLCVYCMSSLHTWLWVPVFFHGDPWLHIVAACLIGPVLTFGMVSWLIGTMVEA